MPAHIAADLARRPLTASEVEVLGLAAEGLTYKQISRRMHLGHTAVMDRLFYARYKLGALNTTHAVAIALRQGILGRQEAEGQEAA